MNNDRLIIPMWAAAAVSLISLMSCKKPQVIENGKEVQINYTLKVGTTVVDSSVSRGPLKYIQGGGQIIPGLEAEMQGMKIGDKKHVTVPAAKGYGDADLRAQQKVPRSALAGVSNLKVGTIVTGQNHGRPVRAKVIAMDKNTVTLDFNHPLAGKTLDFDVEVVDIKDADKAAATAVPQQSNP